MCDCQPGDHGKWIQKKMQEKFTPAQINDISKEADMRYLAFYATESEVNRLFEEITEEL